jgi:CHAT domain-containing protein/lipopolysaccharide biosynthesis regulator YciM
MIRAVAIAVAVTWAAQAADVRPPMDVRQLIDAGDGARARELAMRQLESAPPGIERAHALNALAETWVTGRSADTPKVRELTTQALGIAPQLTEGLVALANQLSRTSERQEAEEVLERAIALDRSDFRLRLLLARFHMLRGDTEGSRGIYEAVVADTEARFGASSSEFAEALTGLGELLNAMHSYADARERLERAIAIEEASPGRGLADSLSDLAYTLYGAGEYRKARDLAERSIALFEADPSKSLVSLGPAYRIRGQSQEALGDYAGARADLERAVEADAKLLGEESMEVADDQNILGIAAANSGDMEGARKRFAGVLAIYEARLGPNNTRTGGALANLAQIQIRLRNFNEARKNLERALAIQIKAAGPESSVVAQLYQKLGQVAMGTGDYDSARKLLRKNLDLWRVQLGPSHFFTVNSTVYLADAELHAGDRAAALRISLEAAKARREYVTDTVRTVSEREALQIAGRSSAVLDTALAVAGDSAEVAAQVWDELIRSRSLVFDEIAARYHAVRSSNDAAGAALLAGVESARSDLARAALSGKTAGLADKRAAVRRAEQALAADSELLRARLKREASGFEEVRSSLPSDAALLAYARFRRPESSAIEQSPRFVYAAFLLRAGAARMIALGDAAKIDAQASALGREIARERDAAGHDERRNEASWRIAGEALRRSVWDPVAVQLAGVRQVYLVTDGALQFVNFGALPVGAEGYLVEGARVFHMLAAERDLVKTAGMTAPSAKTLLTLGNPSFPKGGGGCMPKFEPLPGSARETAEVAGIWRSRGLPVEALTGGRAGEKVLREAVAGKAAIHLATHGFLLDEKCAGDNPLQRSGLELSDGVLTAAQAASLNLESAEWVVLSGCDTGLGDLQAGEGVLGLRRAFQEAGARTVVASLWPVDDEATRGWMGSLYRRRFVQKLPAAQAIRAADLELLRARRAAHLSTHPFYWGSFLAVERE